MLKIQQKFGAIDGSPNLPAAKLALDLSAFRIDSVILALKGGTLAYIDTNGEVATAADAQADQAGFIVNDAAGNDFENVPAYASGKCPIVFGGGIFETDQVVDDDVAIGDALYIGAGGQVTSTDPGSGTVIGYSRTANSASDKTITLLTV